MKFLFALLVAIAIILTAQAQTSDQDQSQAEVLDQTQGFDKKACALKAETGRCKVYLERYSFNPETRICEKFIYGGCGGNDNKFYTEEECQKACS